MPQQPALEAIAARMDDTDRTILEMFSAGKRVRAIAADIAADLHTVTEVISELASNERDLAARLVAIFDQRHPRPTAPPVPELRPTPPPAPGPGADEPQEPAAEDTAGTGLALITRGPVQAAPSTAAGPGERAETAISTAYAELAALAGPRQPLPEVSNLDQLLAAAVESGDTGLAALAGNITTMLARIRSYYDREQHARRVRGLIAEHRAAIDMLLEDLDALGPDADGPFPMAAVAALPGLAPRTPHS
ncbi:hypothetical protein [Actinoplanes sp. NBRC 101535]|uniref:hypothetical protein n=1 Tax=Actinoplanes sp. NBRC 101535 TaxID=3032196 RepID=UPI0024A090B5|nr:hypothetical protein [Actinoplanes sp. NBRC 101535]GLY08282.1 hypothetical protein Acsp01_86610 [Actinoplanes sp. NBRC 101535]